MCVCVCIWDKLCDVRMWGKDEGAGNGICTGLFSDFAPRSPFLAVKFVENGWKDHPPTEGSD